MSVLAVVCFWVVFSWIGGSSISQAHCEFHVGRSVLEVTVADPIPEAWGYYILVERNDDANDFYDNSKRVQTTKTAMVYEVMGIPTINHHEYTVQVRPHRKNRGRWLDEYRTVCSLTIPPPPPPPLPPPPPPSTATHTPPPSPPPASSDAGSGFSLAESVQGIDRSRQTEYGGPSLVLIVIVTCGVVTSCLVVCMTVTVITVVQRKRTQRRLHNPRHDASAAASAAASVTARGMTAMKVAPDLGCALAEEEEETFRSLSDVGDSEMWEDTSAERMAEGAFSYGFAHAPSPPFPIRPSPSPAFPPPVSPRTEVAARDPEVVTPCASALGRACAVDWPCRCQPLVSSGAAARGCNHGRHDSEFCRCQCQCQCQCQYECQCHLHCQCDCQSD